MANEFSELLGKTLVSVKGAEPFEEKVVFECSDGMRLIQQHYQDCCETVEVAEVIGDISDLIGEPLLRAEEVSSSEPEFEGASFPGGWQPESFTWTFYKLATIKGEVVIRWLGESNGYYGEEVDCLWEATT